MKEFIINENEAGQRFDKYLGKLLREAPKSFFYKMLRKKNITLNGGRATGNEKLSTGDHVKLFLSDETFGKFAGVQETAARAHQKLDIVYEDDNILLINKSVGMLSQPADDKEPSLVEYLTGYLLESGAVTEASLHTFRPSDHQFVQTTANRIMEILPNGTMIDKITTYDEYLASDEMAKKRHVFEITEEDAQDN